MNDADSVLLSVSAEARQLVAPDYAVLDGHVRSFPAISPIGSRASGRQPTLAG
jgi:hypothetical protein